MPARLIIAMLLTGAVAFVGALAVSSLAGDDAAPASAGGVAPVPLILESSEVQAESPERSAGLPTLAPRRRERKPKAPAPSPPAAAPLTPSAPPPAAYSPPVNVAPPAAPAPPPAREPVAPEPPVDFLNSG